MRISDWSSDVCSSDLSRADAAASCITVRIAGPGGAAERRELRRAGDAHLRPRRRDIGIGGTKVAVARARLFDQRLKPRTGENLSLGQDRTSVVSGKSVLVRVDPGLRPIINKKK